MYLPDSRLDGTVALVTGASHGLGRHIALGLAEAGADIVAIARDRAALERVALDIESLDRRALPLELDVTDTESVREAIPDVASSFGHIWLLVNNAGTNIPQCAHSVTEEAWDEVFSLNTRAAFFMAQTVGREMIESQRGGRIVNITSQMAAVGYFERAAYCASKGAVVQFTKVLAIEWAKYGIRVNCVGPTFIDSPLADRLLPARAREEVLERIPIGRLGRMDEVAAAVAFLASKGADLVTGHHLLADGGWTAW